MLQAAPTITIPSTAPPSIAIIGYACHFPQACDAAAYWSNLILGRDVIREVPPSRWDPQVHFSAVPTADKTYSKWGGFIDDIEMFDPEFFEICAEDAVDIDPLERQFLEVAAQALRHAGYDLKELWQRPVGVFAGSRVGNYASKLGRMRRNSILGIGQNFIAAHLAQLCNWSGPNLVVDTACSSSLVSLHLACCSLASGECELALAGGVDILLDEHPYILLSTSGALSPDGRCHTFDQRANGFVPGEGAGAVLLKPLDRALADGDRIYAVLESSAVNNDGHTMGATTPNQEAQKAVIRQALRRKGIDASSLGYVEAHGTGTLIGDPIELKGLTQVMREFTQDERFCGVGSVKSNMGHLLSAAGIAGVLKGVLALEHRQLPPTLHCDTPNRRFDFDTSPFFLVTTPRPWESRAGIRRAGVSSFGFGGTNAHVILAEAPSHRSVAGTRGPLAPIQFNRRRFWPDRSAASPPASIAKTPRVSAAALGSRPILTFTKVTG